MKKMGKPDIKPYISVTTSGGGNSTKEVTRSAAQNVRVGVGLVWRN